MYDKTHGQYFVPSGTAVLGIEAIDGAIAEHGEYLCMRRCKLKRVLFINTTLIQNDVTEAEVTFNHRPTPGSGTGETLLGTLKFVDGRAIGATTFKDIIPKTFKVGDALLLEHTVQGVDGTAVAGDGFYSFEFEDLPDEASENSEMFETL